MKTRRCRTYILPSVITTSLSIIVTISYAQSSPPNDVSIAQKKTLNNFTQPAAEKENNMNEQTDGRHDFDFLFGIWRVDSRRLARRLDGCTEWQSLPAKNETRPVLGGLGNIDKFTAIFPNGKPIEGMTLRFFDPQTKLWSIYWVDNWTYQLQPPVIGRFEGD